MATVNRYYAGDSLSLREISNSYHCTTRRPAERLLQEMGFIDIDENTLTEKGLYSGGRLHGRGDNPEIRFYPDRIFDCINDYLTSFYPDIEQPIEVLFCLYCVDKNMFSNIEKPNDFLYEKIIETNWNRFSDFSFPVKFQKKIIDKDPSLMRFIKNPTLKIQTEALINDWSIRSVHKKYRTYEFFYLSHKYSDIISELKRLHGKELLCEKELKIEYEIRMKEKLSKAKKRSTKENKKALVDLRKEKCS